MDCCVEMSFYHSGSVALSLDAKDVWTDTRELVEHIDEQQNKTSRIIEMYTISSRLEEWFQSKGIPLRYCYLLTGDCSGSDHPVPEDKYVSSGIQFWFDTPAEAVLFKMECC